jgi:hypothetical protein
MRIAAIAAAVSTTSALRLVWGSAAAGVLDELADCELGDGIGAAF